MIHIASRPSLTASPLLGSNVMRQYNLRPILITVAIAALCSCALPFKLKASVHAQSNQVGVFELSYHSWDKMLNEYGRGVESVRAEIKKVPKDQISIIWDRAYTEAAVHYVEVKGLVPSECSNGIQGIRSRQYEGGWGSTDFRCK